MFRILGICAGISCMNVGCSAAPSEEPELPSVIVHPARVVDTRQNNAAQLLLRTRNVEISFSIPSPLVAEAEAKQKSGSSAIHDVVRFFADARHATLRDETGHVWKVGQRGFGFTNQGGSLYQSREHQITGSVRGTVTFPTPMPQGELTLSVEIVSPEKTVLMRCQTVVRPAWEARKPKSLAVRTIRLTHIKPFRQGAPPALAVELNFSYSAQKPLWLVDEPLPPTSPKGFSPWQPMTAKKALPQYDTLIVGQRYWLQNERGELLEDPRYFQNPMFRSIALSARYPSLQKDGSLQMLFPLDISQVPLFSTMEYGGD
ncbi:MAG: hypothetical protein EOP06_28380, partial [Proteobacteria bacterium]